MSKLRPSQTNRDDIFCPRHNLLKQLERGFLGTVALGDNHQQRAHTEFNCGIRKGPLYATHHRRNIDTPQRKILQAEENLGMKDAVRSGAAKICHGHVVEILLVYEHLATRPIKIEERLQVAEMVGGP